MTYIKREVIHCDGDVFKDGRQGRCEDSFKIESHEIEAEDKVSEDAREHAHQNGWITCRGNDYCPQCQRQL